MERFRHDMNGLFAQLGQQSDDVAITLFINSHRPIGGDVRLHDASFWTPAQADFLRNALLEDAEWSDAVDQLNSDLHRSPWKH